MDKNRIVAIKQEFDAVIHNVEDTDVEFWFARELMALLGYERWENFDKAIQRAMESCQTARVKVSDHFRDFREVTKMGPIGEWRKA